MLPNYLSHKNKNVSLLVTVEKEFLSVDHATNNDTFKVPCWIVSTVVMPNLNFPDFTNTVK